MKYFAIVLDVEGAEDLHGDDGYLSICRHCQNLAFFDRELDGLRALTRRELKELRRDRKAWGRIEEIRTAIIRANLAIETIKKEH